MHQGERFITGMAWAMLLGIILLCSQEPFADWLHSLPYQDKPEAQAAWVQAVGSVLAIFAAVAIAAWQHWADRRNQELAQRNEDLRLADIMRHLVQTSALALAGIAKARTDPNIYWTDEDHASIQRTLREVLKALQGIPVANVPSILSAFVLTRARISLEEACELCVGFKPETMLARYGSEYAGAAWVKLRDDMNSFAQMAIAERDRFR